MHKPSQRKEFESHAPPSCRQCRLLRTELVRCQQEAEQRARADAQKCHAIYDHMERLAMLNMMLSQRNPSSHLVLRQQHQEPDDIDGDGEPSHMLKPLEAQQQSVHQMQAMIVTQAKEIKKLRHQLKTMAPILPLDGCLGKQDQDGSSEVESESESDDGSGKQKRSTRAGLKKLPLTSLHAKLHARDALIHRLEFHATQLATERDVWREKKKRAVHQYQQITETQHTQLKKYAAQIHAQMKIHKRMERDAQQLQQYVAVLEDKLLLRSSRDPEGRRGRALVLPKTSHQVGKETGLHLHQ